MESIMSMAAALQALGVNEETLSAQQRADLDTKGFTIFPNVIEPEHLEQLRETFEQLSAAEGERAGSEVGQVTGVRRLANLVNKGEMFDPIYVNPLVLAAAQYVIGRDFKLHSLNGHDPQPGSDSQPLHADWGKERDDRSVYHVMNSLWMLDDFDEGNGATRIVPGSHHWPGRPQSQMADPRAPHPQQVFITAPAGSVAVFNGHTWHGSTGNRSQRMRRVYHCAFVAREHAQQTNQREYLRPETAARLSPAARYILDV